MASSGISLTERQMPLPHAHGARRRKAENTFVLLLPAVLLLYSTLLPQEVRFTIAGQVIFPYRAVSFVLLPWLLNRIATGRMPFRPTDLWMYAGVAWMVISFCAFYGLTEGVRRGGALAFDMLIPFLIVRLCVRNFQDARRLLIIAAPGLLFAGALMMVESVTHRQLVRPFASAIFGQLPYFENGQAVSTAREFVVVRLGLLRSHGPFSHPILAGLFMASFFPLYLNSSVRGWPFVFGLIASLCAIFTVSSAAFVSFIISGLLLSYDRIQVYLHGIGWRFFVFAISVLILFVEMSSQNGVVSIIIRYTLDPQTGFFRQLIWEYGTQSIAEHPWFGIGFTDYERLAWMVNSIDNHWLLLGIRHGVIVPFCILMACLVAIINLSQRSSALSKSDGKLARAFVFSLVGMVFLGFTVAFFGGTLIWFCMLLGIATSLSKDEFIFK